MMLSQRWPWEGLEEKEVIKWVMDGRRPGIPESTRKSNDPAVQTLLEVMRISQKQDSEKRATAREVERFLKKKVRELVERKTSKRKV